MKIVALDDSWHQKYTDFLKEIEGALLYHSIAYRNLLLELLQCESEYYIAVENEKVCGVLPLLKKKGAYGWVYNALPFYGSNGGILTTEERILRALIDKYNQIITVQDVASATMISNPLVKADLTKAKHDLVDERIGQFTKLDYPGDKAESLMSAFHQKTRNMIKKALKSGVDVEIDNGQMSFVYELHEENIRAIGGKPKSKTFFDLIPKYFEAGKDFNIYLAQKDGKPIGALLLFYFKDTVEYFTPVIVEEYRTYQPLSLIIYEAMVQSACNGSTVWNWGGTWLTQEGVYRFKKRWGTADIPYYYYTKINNSELYMSSKETLLSEYENFFVIPFHYLSNRGSENNGE